MNIQVRSKFFYISSGEQNKLYTLRRFMNVNGHESDRYVINLGANYEESVEKAKAYLGDMSGELVVGEEFGLEKITRDGSAKIKGAADLVRGIMPWGKYQGQEIAEIAKTDSGLAYLHWMYTQSPEFVKKILEPYFQKYEQIQAEKQAKIDAERKAQAELSNHVGSVGDKIEVEVTVISKFNIDTIYGGSDIIIFKDGQGNQFKAYYTGSTVFERGDIVKLRGTVKGHGEYKDVKQTQLTRIKKV